MTRRGESQQRLSVSYLGTSSNGPAALADAQSYRGAMPSSDRQEARQFRPSTRHASPRTCTSRMYQFCMGSWVERGRCAAHARTHAHTHTHTHTHTCNVLVRTGHVHGIVLLGIGLCVAPLVPERESCNRQALSVRLLAERAPLPVGGVPAVLPCFRAAVLVTNEPIVVGVQVATVL